MLTYTDAYLYADGPQNIIHGTQRRRRLPTSRIEGDGARGRCCDNVGLMEADADTARQIAGHAHTGLNT